MGKKRKAKKRYRGSRKAVQDRQRTQREAHDFTKTDRLLGFGVFKTDKVGVFDDRRRWRPSHGLPLMVDGKDSRLTIRKPKSPTHVRDYTRSRLAFSDPRRVKECRRRRKRRETLFKMGKIGRGKKGPRFRKLTEYSDVRC